MFYVITANTQEVQGTVGVFTQKPLLEQIQHLINDYEFFSSERDYDALFEDGFYCNEAYTVALHVNEYEDAAELREFLNWQAFDGENIGDIPAMREMDAAMAIETEETADEEESEVEDFLEW